VDRIDRFIINELTKNGRTSFLKIAKQLGVSPLSVQKRYKKMKENGIILCPTILIDLSKIGYQGKAYLMITENPEYDKKETLDFLEHLQNVFFISEIIGEFDILAMVPFRDFKDVVELVDRIRALPHVSRVEIALTSDTSFPITKYYSKMLLPRTEP
jgi:Lrp/AsnC family leucine-responsive transcriptional regulator